MDNGFPICNFKRSIREEIVDLVTEIEGKLMCASDDIYWSISYNPDSKSYSFFISESFDDEEEEK